MKPGIISIIFNVLGGIIVAVLIVVWHHFRTVWKRRRLRLLFGDDIESDFHISNLVYVPQDRSALFDKPPSKILRRTPGGTNLDAVCSRGVTRGIGYLSHRIGKLLREPIPVIGDDEDNGKLDLSFVALGATNHRSWDILNSTENGFLQIDNHAIQSATSNLPIVPVKRMSGGHDYGIIVKIHPPHNRKRTWICCAGFAEWGTSGAAWYLASKWSDITKSTGNKPFALVTKTTCGSDDSTEFVHRFVLPEQVEKLAQEIEQHQRTSKK